MPKENHERKMTSTLNISRRFPFWISPIFALVFIRLYYTLAGDMDFPCRTFLMLLLLAAFILMAIIMPLQILTETENGIAPWYPLALAMSCAIFLFGYFMLGGSRETWGGGEYPHFGYRFPVVGYILDAIVISLGLRTEAYYPPGYELILWGGLFIEVVLVSAVIYVITVRLRSQKNANPDQDT
jgi:hypothetical protein